MGLFFPPLPEALAAMPREERNAALQAISRKNPILWILQIIPNILGSIAASLTFNFYRAHNPTGADLFVHLPLALFFWIILFNILSTRYLYGPRFQNAAAEYFATRGEN